MSANTKKKKNKSFFDDNPIEAVRDYGFFDQVKPSSNDFFDQLFGRNAYKAEKHHGELSEGEEFDVSALEGQKKHDVEPGIDYRREILHSESIAATKESREMEQKISEIVAELRQLISASAELQTQFKHVAVEQRIEKPGKYHLNFFEWMLIVIKTARMRVEDSQNWLSMFASKKKQKGYWQQFKKHGTTFGLSNERVVATQTG